VTTKQQKFKSNNLTELKSERFFLVLVLLKFFSSGNKICSNNERERERERERESLEAATSDGCTGIAKLHYCNWKILVLEKLALVQHEICGPIRATAVETHLSNCDGESEDIPSLAARDIRNHASSLCSGGRVYSPMSM
jgi:hypothetical protein